MTSSAITAIWCWIAWNLHDLAAEHLRVEAYSRVSSGCAPALRPSGRRPRSRPAPWRSRRRRRRRSAAAFQIDALAGVRDHQAMRGHRLDHRRRFRTPPGREGQGEEVLQQEASAAVVLVAQQVEEARTPREPATRASAGSPSSRRANCSTIRSLMPASPQSKAAGDDPAENFARAAAQGEGTGSCRPHSPASPAARRGSARPGRPSGAHPNAAGKGFAADFSRALTPRADARHESFLSNRKHNPSRLRGSA